MRSDIIAMIGVFICAVSLCTGQTPPPAAEPATIFRAGAGLLIVDKPHKGGDTKVLPIPAIFYQQGRLVLSGTQARWVFYYDDGLTVSALGKLRNEGYRSSESRYLRGMGHRRATVEAGLSLSQDFSWGKLTAEWVSDTLNEHKGHEIRLLADRRFAPVLGGKTLAVTPGVGVNWRSKQLNDYYYGVERNEATGDRRAYNVGSTIGLLTSVRLDYPVGDRWNVFGAVSVEWLGSEISDSPIVEQHHRTSVFMGAMYRF